MKKMFFALFASALLLSCSDDDSPSVNKIVGTWKLTAFSENGSPAILTDCEKTSTAIFNEEKQFTLSDNYDNGQNCESEVFSGSWENTSGKNYKLVSGSQSVNLEATFSGNTMNLKFSDGPNDYTVSTYTKQ